MPPQNKPMVYNCAFHSASLRRFNLDRIPPSRFSPTSQFLATRARQTCARIFSYSAQYRFMMKRTRSELANGTSPFKRLKKFYLQLPPIRLQATPKMLSPKPGPSPMTRPLKLPARPPSEEILLSSVSRTSESICSRVATLDRRAGRLSAVSRDSANVEDAVESPPQ